MTHDLLMAVGRVALAAALALVLVLAVRMPARRWLGAAFAYRLWLLVPVAALATLLPAPVRPLIPALQVAPSAPPSSAIIELQAAVAQSAPFDWQPWLLASWIVGALALVVVFVHQQRRYLKNLGALSTGDHGAWRAQATDGCPALVGALRPRIVVPSDFESRYTPRERELVLAHERTHLARGDAQINALAALLRCLNWFNPLFHLAASRFRFDQEIACDAAVMSRFSEARRCYADAMLKAQRVGESRQELRLPAGCLWPASHPLKERIAMLKFPALTGLQRALASAAIVALVSGVGYASWAAQPGSPGVTEKMQNGSVRQPGRKFVQTDFAISIDGVRVGGTGTQHSQDKLSPGKRWVVAFDSTRDGVVQISKDLNAISLLNRFGDVFKISASRENERWEVEGVANDLGNGTIQFDGKVFHDGALTSAPSLVVVDGRTAAIVIGGSSAAPVVDASGMAAPVFDDDSAQVSARVKKGFRLELTPHKFSDTAPSENLSYRRMYPPKYPPEAVRNHVAGKVVLKVTIDDEGVPTSTEVRSVEPEESAHVLADAAIAAAMQWRYNPGTKDGRPVGGEILVPVSFMLDDDNGAPTQPQVVASDSNVSYRKMRPPVYPREAIAAKITGTLYVRVRIDANGNVADAYVDQAVPVSALALKETALAALKSWQFNPAMQNGRVIESEALVPVRFRIEGEAAPTATQAPVTPDSVRKLETIVVTGAAA